MWTGSEGGAGPGHAPQARGGAAQHRPEDAAVLHRPRLGSRKAGALAVTALDEEWWNGC